MPALPRNDSAVVIVHGGAGHTREHEDGCVAAARMGAAVLREGKSALSAAVAAVTRMEEDGRFNAGRGAELGLDGSTFEMCASVMDTQGALGSVICVRDVRHPVQLAEAVSRTPHWSIAGEGADRLARHLNMAGPEHDLAQAHQQLKETLGEMAEPKPLIPGVDNGEFSRLWNYATPWAEAVRRHGCGTVGAVVRSADGNFAVATSTGGVAPSLLGRVGDTPIIGCGFFCGPLGAIGATGIGEEIVRQLLARTVYGWLAEGRELQDALDAGIALFDDDIDVGLIGVTRTAHASASKRPMPVGVMELR